MVRHLSGASSKLNGEHDLPVPSVAHNHYARPLQNRFPLSISKALKDECNVHHKAFAMMLIDERGQLRTHVSPMLERHGKIIFPREARERFEQIVNQQLADGGPRVPKKTVQDDKFPSFLDNYRSESPPLLHGHSSKRSEVSKGVIVERQSRPAKRRKSSATHFREVRWGPADDSDSPVDSDSVGRSDEIMCEQIEVGDTKALDEYYDSRFKQFQQLNCKAVAKAWIKVIEPKKQTNWPYKDSETNGPPWWPKDCRHREPDHLKKPERLKLLMTMLRLWKTDTSKNITVSKLQASTNEIINTIKPPEKRPILDEIYRVAKEEERYVRGEIDADTLISVMPSDKAVKSPRERNPSTDTEEIALPSNGSFEGPEAAASRQDIAAHMVSPINQLALPRSRSDQHSVASTSPASLSNGPEFYQVVPRQVAEPHRASMTPCDYQQQYPNSMPIEDSIAYMESSGIQLQPGMSYLPRGTTFAPPNPGGPALRDRAYPQSTNAQTSLYQQWPSPSINGAISGQLSYTYSPVHGTTSNQPLCSATFQLPHPPPHSQGALPPMVQQPAPQAPLPDLLGARVQPPYDGHVQGASFRTGSLSHPHGLPGHGYDLLQDEMQRNYLQLNANDSLSK